MKKPKEDNKKWFIGNNEGSTFLLVIICVIFVAMIGVIALSMASDYLVTVSVDDNSTENFYDAESVLTEVQTGLQERALDCANASYKAILENYKASGGETRTDRFSNQFLSLLAEKLVDTGAVTWNSEHDYEKPCKLEKIKELTKSPDAVKPVSGETITICLHKSDENEYSMRVKNLMIDLEDEAGYRSTIETDIVIKVPDYNLDGDSTFNELKKYVVITDDTLKVNSTVGITGTTFTGNIYTGNKNNGILVHQGAKAIFQNDLLISRGDFNVESNCDVSLRANDGTENGELWLQNFKLTKTSPDGSSLSSKVDISANAFVANDLVINDTNSEVTLGGSYYGYSYNKENTESTVTFDAKYSSAILVNGLNTTLKTPNLDQLILAGRAFVARNNESGTKMTSDIMTGESLSVKSNQLAYLVPEEYISADHNPVLSTEKDVTVDKTALLADPSIGAYVKSDEPYTKNYIASVGGFSFVYYFLNFKDEDSANQYFRQYYLNEVNMLELQDKARTYISTTDSAGMKLDAKLFLLAGNIVHNYYQTEGATVETSDYFDGSGNPKTSLLEDGKEKGKEYVGRQMTLLPAAGSTMRLAEDAEPLVATKIIDYDKVSELVIATDVDFSSMEAEVRRTAEDFTISASTPDESIVIANGNVTVAKKYQGLIIAGGNVTIASDFDGLILAKGEVSVTNSGVKATYNTLLVKKLLKEIAENKKLAECFFGISSFDGSKNEVTDISDYFSYENWKKNSN